MSDLSQMAIQACLDTEYIGHPIYYYEQIGSTNAALKMMADEGASEGTVLIANEQRAGYGRFERPWQAAAGTSLLSSILFRPNFLSALQVQQLTMLCTLAAVEAIEAQTGLAVDIKWPNDLVYHRRKLAGVLTEVSFIGQKLAWVVVGMGLNVNQDQVDGHKTVEQVRTTLQTILGQPVLRLDLFQAYLYRVESHYEALRSGSSPHHAWATRLVTLGQNVTITSPETQYGILRMHGIAKQVDQTGALWIETETGDLKSVLAGEVTLRNEH